MVVWFTLLATAWAGSVYYSGVLCVLLLCRVLVDLEACQGERQVGLFFAWV